MVPSSAGVSPAIVRSRVDLPVPDGSDDGDDIAVGDLERDPVEDRLTTEDDRRSMSETAAVSTKSLMHPEPNLPRPRPLRQAGRVDVGGGRVDEPAGDGR